LLSLGCACSYFFNGLVYADLKRREEVIPGLHSFAGVIQAIREDKGLQAKQILILVVQLDEFQDTGYLSLCMLRGLEEFMGFVHFIISELS